MAMLAPTDDIVIRPFREVVEKGGEAVTNAEDAADNEPEASAWLYQSGQSLVKEGERAIKRLRPLMKDRTPEFYSAVKDLLAQNNNIVEKHRILDDLLYDFEDYLDVDSFEVDKYRELQAATKSLALAIMEAVRIITLEPPKEAPRPSAFPPLPPLPNAVRNEAHPAKLRSEQVAARLASQRRAAQPSPAPGMFPQDQPRAASRQRRFDPSGLSSQPLLDISAAVGHVDDRSQRPPSPARRPVPYGTTGDETDRLDLMPPPRPRVPSHESSSPEAMRAGMDRLALSPDSPVSSMEQQMGFSHGRTPTLPQPSHMVDRSPTQESAMSWRLTASSSGQSSAASDITATSSNRTSVASTPMGYPSPKPAVPALPEGMFPRPTTSPSSPPEVNDAGPVPPSQAAQDAYRSLSMNRSPSVASTPSARRDGSTRTERQHSTVSSASSSRVNGYPPWRRVDYTVGPGSTFQEMRGFCKGARVFRANGVGEAIKKVGGGPSNAQESGGFSEEMLFGQMYTAPEAIFTDPMAQCTSCEYSHKYTHLVQDTDKDSLANQQAYGVNYRKRFLYKSHVITRNNNRPQYACLFCVQAGHVPREGDATVFSSAPLLFRHLARHPQPLPKVPGVTVLQGAVEADHPNVQDYDVHFPNPPVSPGGPPTEGEMAAQIGLLPVATAVRDHIQYADEKPLARPDKTVEMLQFYSGARIVGVEFPEKWGGKWCQGWHDGTFGAFPVRNVQLEAPKRNTPSLSLQQQQQQLQMQLQMQTPQQQQQLGGIGSRRSGVTKWKWDAKGGAGNGWLGFDKGEHIMNLEWDDPEAWYWTGTNSKGRVGIFPSSHMRIETIRDGSLESGVPQSKPKKSLGKFFGLGRRDSRGGT